MGKPVVAQRGPCSMKVVAGRRYLWCACGLSRKQPLCDGAHAGSGILPMFWTAKEDGEVHFCGCKQTANRPLCDGSHNSLPPGDAAE